MRVEPLLHFVMRIKAGVEDECSMKGEATDGVGASAGSCYGAFLEVVDDPSGHLLVGVHDEISHPFVAEMAQEAEIIYQEEADLGVSGRPAIGYLRIVDYGADHAGALTLDLHRLYDP